MDELAPTPEQLADALTKIVKNGLGRDLYEKKSMSVVQPLIDLSRKLTDDPSEDWKFCVARVVIEGVRDIRPEAPNRLALIDVLAIGDLSRDTDEIITAIDREPAVDDLEDRHQEAASWYLKSKGETLGARQFSEKRRRGLFIEVGEGLLKTLREKRQEERGGPTEEHVVLSPSPTLLAGVIGVLLIGIGVGWLLAFGVIG